MDKAREKEFWKVVKGQWKFNGFKKRYNFKEKKYGLFFKDDVTDETEWIFPDFSSPWKFCVSIKQMEEENNVNHGTWFALNGLMYFINGRLCRNLLGREI